MKYIRVLMVLGAMSWGMAQAVLDYSCERSPDLGFTLFNERPVAAVFEVGQSGLFTQLDFYAAQLDPDGFLIIEVRSVVDGRPTDDVLTMDMVPLTELPSSSPGGTGPGWVTWEFSDPVLVQSGGQLAIVMYRDRGGISPRFGVLWAGPHDPTACPSEGFYLIQGYGWEPHTTFDFGFRTYVNPVVVPALSHFGLWVLGILLAAIAIKWNRKLGVGLD